MSEELLLEEEREEEEEEKEEIRKREEEKEKKREKCPWLVVMSIITLVWLCRKRGGPNLLMNYYEMRNEEKGSNVTSISKFFFHPK